MIESVYLRLEALSIEPVRAPCVLENRYQAPHESLAGLV
jgi:hypothetical protein